MHNYSCTITVFQWDKKSFRRNMNRSAALPIYQDTDKSECSQDFESLDWCVPFSTAFEKMQFHQFAGSPMSGTAFAFGRCCPTPSLVSLAASECCYQLALAMICSVSHNLCELLAGRSARGASGSFDAHSNAVICCHKLQPYQSYL